MHDACCLVFIVVYTSFFLSLRVIAIAAVDVVSYIENMLSDYRYGIEAFSLVACFVFISFSA